MSSPAFAHAIELYREFVDPNWIDILESLGFLNEIVEAHGSFLVDRSGKRHLDLIAGFGSAVLGHNCAGLTNAIISVLGAGAPSIVPLGVSASAAMLAGRLSALTGQTLTKVHFATTGAEAIEHAMRVSIVVTGRTEFISGTGGYHGLTLGVLGLTQADSPWRAGLDGWPTSSVNIDLYDFGEVKRYLETGRFAALIMEVVQGVGGCKVFERLRSLQELCNAYGTLLVVDEVLTGLGRTGMWFGFQNVDEPSTPEMVIVSKGLSCGVAPISAVLMKEDVWKHHAEKSGAGLSLSSTLAGNLLGTTVGLASLEMMEQNEVLNNVRSAGTRIVEGLSRLVRKPVGVGEIRGKGLLIAFEVECNGDRSYYTAAQCWRKLLDRGVLTSIAAHSPGYIRLTPALTITEAEIDQFLITLDDVFLDMCTAAA